MTSLPDVAVLHDRIPQWGGGERFAFAAARALDAPVYTAYVDPSVAPELPDDVEVIPLYQSKYKSNVVARKLLGWSAGRTNPLETVNVGLDLTKADLRSHEVVLESAPLSKWYVPREDQTVVHYPHSPPRWVYDQYRDRVAAFPWPGVEFAVKLYAKAWRTFDKEANSFVDAFVANSELVARRIRRFWGVEAEVVYPPISGDWRTESDDGYFVTWSRLVPNKRFDLLIEAFAGLDERLVVAGDGPLREDVERMAAGVDNVEYRGYVEDIESLVARATAVVYAPRDEDFGLVGAETLAAGKPLIGVDEGFTRYQVEPGVTGERFDPTVEALRETVAAFDPADYDSETIRERASAYTVEAFDENIRRVVREAHDGN